MARTGRPPKPTEIKRKNGNPGRRKLPDRANVVSLAPAQGIPEPPVPFGLEGQRLWSQVWSEGVVWIAPASDMTQVVEACRLADDIEIARERYVATREPADGRMVTSFSKALSEALSALGFNPAARTRLGVAEVRRMSALEELAAKRGNR